MGWKDFVRFEGQTEKGENGTPHIQGMLITKSVKFSAVKRQFNRAHIEIARNASALAKYVHKEETRIGELKTTKVATVLDLNRVIDDVIRIHEDRMLRSYETVDEAVDRLEKIYGEVAGIKLLDLCVRYLIDTDYYGIEYIGANPSIRATWKLYWKNILKREYRCHPADEPQRDEDEEDHEKSQHIE